MLETTELLANFTLVLRTGGTDILVQSQPVSVAAIVFPWHVATEDLGKATQAVAGMGFTDIVEAGNLPGYVQPGSDTDDFDYMICVQKGADWHARVS
jgi:hypothetical protein